ncbi:hypothetical protein ACS0TY_028079 [Phlomoides rotata]
MAKSCPVRTVVQPSAEAPTAAPADINLISLLARQGCKSFSGMLTAQGADDVFTKSIKEGLTVFCPSDDAVKSFAPSYKNLTAAGKTSLLLYHALACTNRWICSDLEPDRGILWPPRERKSSISR